MAYLEGLAQNQAHNAVLEVLQKLSGEGKVTRASIARKLGKDPAQITRWLSSPGNWTLQTMALLLAAMGHVPKIDSQPVSQQATTNYFHPAVELSRTASSGSASRSTFIVVGTEMHV